MCMCVVIVARILLASYSPLTDNFDDPTQHFRIRPYCAESTASRPISEVKLRQASLVLGWETTRESGVPYPFLLVGSFSGFCLRVSQGMLDAKKKDNVDKPTLDRYATSKDIADAVALLCAPAAHFISTFFPSYFFFLLPTITILIT